MVRFVVWSDLHQEFGRFDPPSPESFPGRIDGVLLAGDTDTEMRHLDFAETVARLYDCPVVLVNGNHEYYGSELTLFEIEEQRKLADIHARGVPVHLLKGDCAVVKGVRIAGATLWTDFALDPSRVTDAMQCAETVMADYRAIKIDDGGIRPLRANDVLARHREDRTRLWDTLKTPFDGRTLVMTHHMPVSHAIHPRYASHPLLNAAFANNLGADIAQLEFDAWICGHSHTIPPVEIASRQGPRSLVSNPRGYPHEITGFDPFFTLEV